MKKWIKEVLRPSWGMVAHAAAGFGLALVIAAFNHPVATWTLCPAVSVLGMMREFAQARWSWEEFNLHKAVEGLCWSICWVALAF